MGSLCILGSFAMIRGPYQFIVKDMLLNKEKGIFAWLYLVSLFVTIYASMVMKSYLITIPSLIVEVICLLFFICSYFPGGTTGMKALLRFCWGIIKKPFS